LSDKDYEVRAFIGRDFARLEPITVRYNESLVDLAKKEKWDVDKKTGEIKLPEGKKVEDMISTSDVIKLSFSLTEIMAIVKSGVKKPGTDHKKEYTKSLIDVKSWDSDKIFKAYDEVMEVKKNEDFFNESVIARSRHLDLGSSQSP
jgi:hypothetical protein